MKGAAGPTESVGSNMAKKQDHVVATPVAARTSRLPLAHSGSDLLWAVNLRRRDFHFLRSCLIPAATRWKTLEFVSPRV